MTKRRPAPALVLLALAAGVGVWQFFGDADGYAGANSAEVQDNTPLPPLARASSEVQPTVEVPTPGVARARTEDASPLVRHLDTVAAETLVEQLALRQAAERTGLILTDAEWQTLAEVTAHFQAVRQSYEAEVGQVTPLGAGRFQIEVPAYGAAGDALRAAYFTELERTLGANAAQRIQHALGRDLEGRFAGFGVGVQTLEFHADADSPEAYQVTRTIQYWNAAEGGNRLTTRRETHFPGLEDSTGHRWGPFLELLARNVGTRAGS